MLSNFQRNIIKLFLSFTFRTREAPAEPGDFSMWFILNRITIVLNMNVFSGRGRKCTRTCIFQISQYLDPPRLSFSERRMRHSGVGTLAAFDAVVCCRTSCMSICICHRSLKFQLSKFLWVWHPACWTIGFAKHSLTLQYYWFPSILFPCIIKGHILHTEK